MQRLFRNLLLLLLPTLSMAEEKVTPWLVDHPNSSVTFSVNHMMISEIQGRFHDFYASVYMDGDEIESLRLILTVNVGSVDTALQQRDEHLRSKDFLDTSRYPKLIFKSSGVRHLSGKLYALKGDLTVKGVTDEVEFQLIYGGVVTDYWGNKRTAFKVVGDFNRFDFGLNWNELLEQGGLIVGQDVNVMATLEAYQQEGAFDLAEQALLESTDGVTK